MREVIPAPLPGLDLRREYGHHQSPAIRAGGLIFCSGMVAVDPATGERQDGTVTSETRRVAENPQLLLASAGASLDRLVQVHAMINDRIEYDVLNREYRRHMPSAIFLSGMGLVDPDTWTPPGRASSGSSRSWSYWPTAAITT